MREKNIPIEFDNCDEFSQFIEEECRITKQSYIDAIIAYCAGNFIDIEDMKNLIAPALREKIKAEAISLGMMQSMGKLDW